MTNLENIHTIKAINNEKSSTVTILLFLFLGFFAAHRFYAQGVTVFNLLYLVTGGFFMIGIIVDFFLVWNMTEKANTTRITEARIKDSAYGLTA